MRSRSLKALPSIRLRCDSWSSCSSKQDDNSSWRLTAVPLLHDVVLDSRSDRRRTEASIQVQMPDC